MEEECDLQDYEGSRLYDEYPDRFMLYHLGRKIVDEVRSEADMEAMSDGLLGDLVEVLLFMKYHEEDADEEDAGEILQIRRIKMTIRGCCERSEQ